MPPNSIKFMIFNNENNLILAIRNRRKISSNDKGYLSKSYHKYHT